VAALLLLAALVQGAVVARLPWPGSGEPQLAALAMTAVALVAGPRVGAVTGFSAGLLLDLLPPASHALGQWAFVLCLLGYLLGMLAGAVAHSARLMIPVAAVAAALAPLAFTLFGQLLADPRADLPGAAQRLPAAALWTLLLAVPLLAPLRRRRGHGNAYVIEPVAPRVPLAVR
jgi:rod shape-determining protein MreD